MGDLSPAFGKRLEKNIPYDEVPDREVLNEAQRDADIPRSLNAREMADFIINSWEGAIVRMKVQKNTDALRLFDRMIFNGSGQPGASSKGGIGNGKRAKAGNR
jgi:TetR/AcrR family transcriptional repressor of nem operon